MPDLTHYTVNFHVLGYQLLTIAPPGTDLTALEKHAQAQNVFTAYDVRDSGHVYVWCKEDLPSSPPPRHIPAASAGPQSNRHI